jgi:hypothetical protein
MIGHTTWKMHRFTAALPSQEEKIRMMNESNVYGGKSVLHSHPEKRVRYQTEKYGFL